MPDTRQSAPIPSVYQLRVVVRGVSPLIWRRLLIPADTSIAGRHAVLQIAFGWNGDHASTVSPGRAGNCSTSRSRPRLECLGAPV